MDIHGYLGADYRLVVLTAEGVCRRGWDESVVVGGFDEGGFSGFVGCL